MRTHRSRKTFTLHGGHSAPWRFFISPVLLAWILALLTACAPTPAAPAAPTTALPPTAPPAAHTLAPTLAPTLLRVGGVPQDDGTYRYTSRRSGVSLALPVEWVCVNMDDDLYQPSMDAARASMDTSIGFSGRFLDNLEAQGNIRIYCFIPDESAFAHGTQLVMYLLDTLALGFNNIWDVVDYAYGETTCDEIDLSMGGLPAGFSRCQLPSLGPGGVSITLLEYYYDVLEVERYLTLHFRGTSTSAAVLEAYGQAAAASFHFEE